MKMKLHTYTMFYIFILVSLSLQSTSAIDFIFNGFNSTNISVYGNATIESQILTLTKDFKQSIGRGLYSSRIATKNKTSSEVLPFSTSFIFAMAPFEDTLSGHGIVFLFVPFDGIQGASAAQHMGFLNRTYNDGNPNNHIFGIEFDVFKNQEFSDIDNNHVGIDVSSLTSLDSFSAGYWSNDDQDVFKRVRLNNGKNYQVWVDYKDGILNVTIAPVGMIRPRRPLLSYRIDLSRVFMDDMYVGFTASTGVLVESHKILSWSFSNSNFSLWKGLVTEGLPSFELPKEPIWKSKRFIVGIALGVLFVVVVCYVIMVLMTKRRRRLLKERAEMEDWELEYWPHRIPYQEIDAATKGFSDENVIGIGGNGKVYKGVLTGGVEVAVKRISHANGDGVKEFLAEVSSLGRLKHKTLVALRGWCRKDRGSLILVYDYMENGSLDKRVFNCAEDEMLSCEDRIKVLKDVASGLLYLHEGWESTVLHRDIKASNVLLDKDMNGRLGDFGLARIHGSGQVASTTQVVGTVGYLPPEVIKNGRVSILSDVFGFGVLILEVMCGRRPLEEGKLPLIEWVWKLMEKGEILNVLDPRLRARGGYDADEVELLLNLGLLCVYPDARVRPKMRKVTMVLEEQNEIEEPEGEDMDIHLLKKLKAKDFWSKYSQSSSDKSSSDSHPTLDQIREGISASLVSLSWSDFIKEGR
ncbi:Clade VII lectin receptor kinase [Heracleum sosnowskyi]|uniref:non-specific serine/threonine protein kinase n=1 Tax=Heracleum sosnowskyi TaxID=360622 RepID=A0AAD8I563_9APIA|nr:Clade VII lectin receptor kinase [Heracleum sosnowskyi]